MEAGVGVGVRFGTGVAVSAGVGTAVAVRSSAGATVWTVAVRSAVATGSDGAVPQAVTAITRTSGTKLSKPDVVGMHITCSSYFWSENPEMWVRVWCVEATGGFEPPNRGFADLRLRPLGYVALTSVVLVPRAGFEPTQAMPTTPSRWRVYQFHHLGSLVAILYHSPARLQRIII